MKTCAYCYAEHAEEVVIKRCGQCQKRTYCSKACQKLDWKKPGGQQHKLYCGKAGELGHCFEVKESGEKGLGLFAMRDFTKNEMIMVERPLLNGMNLMMFPQLRPSEQSAFTSLAPNEGDLHQKFVMNRFGDDKVCIHMSRVNHDCYGNSSYLYLQHRGVHILVAKKEIKAGEEITFSYKSLLHNTPSERRDQLRQKYGIRCGLHCGICSNAALDARAEELNQAQRQFLKYLQNCCNGTCEMDLDFVLEMGSELRRFYDEFEVHSPPYIQ
ncbi:unnamed protein product, partial [Heterosigma akashiwo]